MNSMNTDKPLQAELETFEQMKDRLLEDEGKFAVIHKTELIGIFSSYEDALKAGYQKVNLLPFLVKKITAIEPLGLTPSGFILCHTPSTAGTPVQLPQYDMGLFLYHEDHTKFFQNLAITASDFSQQNIHGLLGRDVLEHCLLVYDGRIKNFALAF